MPRKAKLLQSLSRGRVRASFNKYNLFNLYKKSQLDFKTRTLYQQKWSAKQETRAYHGEHLTESRWKSTFEPDLKSVAQLDASLKGGNIEPTPILMQTYAVLEKRLEFAVFRAMFASSIRQARQFILHGNVYVNGVKMVHPGFILKPGDIFNVKQEKVAEALGAKKPSLQEALKIDKKQIKLWNRYVTAAREKPLEVWNSKIRQVKSLPDSHSEKQQFLEFLGRYNDILETRKLEAVKGTSKQSILESIVSVGEGVEEQANVCADDFESKFYGDKSLAQSACAIYKALLEGGVFEKYPKIAADELSKKVLEMKDMNEPEKIKKAAKSVSQSLNEFVKQHDNVIRLYYDNKKGNPDTCELPYDPEWAKNLPLHPDIDIQKLLEDPAAAEKAVNLPWQKGLFGREDPSKPYFTPWKPRPFLAPFAVLPHHLEISFKTCRAIYLRDPVARPGHSEVITPFSLPVHERAYMYYVRKGK